MARLQFNRIYAGLALASQLVTGCATLEEDFEEARDTAAPSAPLLLAPPETAVAGHYIVVFRDDVSAASIRSAMDEVARLGSGNAVRRTYSVIPGFSARLDDAAVEALRANPRVAFIEQDRIVKLTTTYPSPADGIDRIDQREGHDGSYDDHGRHGAGVHLYVIDTGINTRHQEFTGRIGNGATAINDGRGIEDCNGHGTHVSSTAAGTTYGVAKRATIHPIRVLDCSGGGTWEGVIAGVDFVRTDCANQNGPCVANMSLGGGRFEAANLAVANAVAAGIPFAIAAGNWNDDACRYSPASELSAITVAATADNDARAGFSNFGTCVDIFAPGVSILGAWIGSTTATLSIDGTSMASPHVAGAAAQVLGSSPTLTPAQVRTALLSSASLECVTDPRGTPNVLLFNDFAQGNYTCGDAAGSCEGLCGGPSDGCFCDASCVEYGDCCPDYGQFCG